MATAIGDSELEPHVYEISSQAFRSLALDKRDQTILVLGESGSGKTETVKIVLEHLTTLGGGRSSSMARGGDDVVKKVLQSSIVFEAFGNAKTQHNINSSRFGKYTQLQFAEDAADTTASTGPACHSLVGSVCTIYLLEKSRVASRSGAERNFHIFYQLLCAPEDFRRDMWPFFAACKVEDFKFLANSMGSSNRDDIRRDTASWTQTLQALEAFHIKGSLFKMLMEAVAIVLQLGNIQFSSERSPKGVVQTIISSTTELDILSEMTGIERKDLEIMLTTRSVKTNFEDIRSPQDPDAAKEAVDSLAKEIYARIFESITRQVNEQSKSSLPADALGGIGILDFYGFERLEVNQFEQLCINYANEQLQQKYVADNFRILKTEYDEEGIDIFDFSLVDNSSVLHLLDGRNGVFVKLLEECMKPNGSAESFISKIKESNNSSDRLIVHKHFKRKEFCINHFAGPCTYNASTFVNRNMDKLPEELMTCFSKTTNNVIRKELLYVIQKQPQAGGKKRKQKANGTLLEKFSFELRDLLVTIESTDARYIRCIVPNGTRSPRVTNHLMTLRQLESAGLMTAVALSRESFPDSLSYNTLLSRFKCLMTRKDQQNLKQMAVPDQIVYMLTNLFMSMFDEEDANLASMPFACGTSKAYLRAGALEHLEYLRFRFLSNQAVIIQRLGRKKRAERVYSRQREAVTKIQAVARSFILRHRFMEKRQASIKLASWFLQRKPERESITLRRGNAAGKIQYVWQSMNQQRNYHQARVAAIITFRSKRRAATGLKKDDELEDDISTLLGRIALRRGALPSDRFPEQSLLAEIET